MGMIHRHALRLVDRRRIAMIDMSIVFEVERDRTSVGAHGHGGAARALDRSERAILHRKAALVAQEDDAVAGSERTLAALDLDRDILAQIARRAPPIARRLVERAHLPIGAGADDPRISGAHLPLTIHSLAPRLARRPPRLAGVH